MSSNKEMESTAFDLASQVALDNTQRALNAYIQAGGRSLSGGVYIAMGSVIGALTVLATALAPKDGVPDNDTFLFAALLVTACCDIGEANKGQSEGKEHTDVAVQTDWSPMQQAEAMCLFEKMTGRKPDGHVVAGLLEAAREVQTMGTNAANDLLAAVCANRKPA